MHSCSSAQGNMVGPCPCGLFHGHNQCSSSSISILWPGAMASSQYKPPYDEPSGNYYSYSPYSSPSVDCTLSLGTPSTRRSSSSSSSSGENAQRHDRRSGGGSCMSNFCWDFLQTKHSHSNASTKSGHRTGTNNHSTNNNNGSSGGDPLLARRCANCDTTSTPLWRNGPRGPKSLCNACGIRFKKEERRATAAAANNAASGGGGMMDSHVAAGYYNGSWSHQAQKMQYFSPAMGNEFRFIDDVESRDSDSGIQFLSWRLNVTDRPTSLVHDFTR